MPIDLNAIVKHDMSDECPACRAQEFVEAALLPAAAAWELRNELPRFSIALHGAAGLLSALLEEGVPRGEVEAALSGLLDDIEQQIAEAKMTGGSSPGSARH